jgi:hypothetical protein
VTPCNSWWLARLSTTTITVGINNVFDQDPSFVAHVLENKYDQQTANYQGANLVCGVDKAFLKTITL